MAGSTTASGSTPTKEQLANRIQQLMEANNELKAQLTQKEQHVDAQTQKGKFTIPAPEKYDGARGKLKPFLTQLALYIKFNEKAIPSAADQVLAASTLLKDEAYDWIQPWVQE